MPTIRGEVQKLQPLDGLAAQVLKGDDLRLLDTLGGQGARSPNGAQVHGPVALHGLYNFRAALALADHTLEPQVQKPGGVGVHAAAGGGPAGADGQPLRGRGGPGVVDGRPLQGVGDVLSLVQQLADPLVGRVPGGVAHPGEQHPLPRPQGGGKLCHVPGVQPQRLAHLTSPRRAPGTRPWGPRRRRCGWGCRPAPCPWARWRSRTRLPAPAR